MLIGPDYLDSIGTCSSTENRLATRTRQNKKQKQATKHAKQRGHRRKCIKQHHNSVVVPKKPHGQQLVARALTNTTGGDACAPGITFRTVVSINQDRRGSTLPQKKYLKKNEQEEEEESLQQQRKTQGGFRCMEPELSTFFMFKKTHLYYATMEIIFRPVAPFTRYRPILLFFLCVQNRIDNYHSVIKSLRHQ